MNDKILIGVSFLLGGTNILATLLSLSKKEYWWIRVFDFPKLQMMFLMFVGLICYGLASRNEISIFDIAYIALLSVTILYQAYKIRPYTAFHKYQSLEAKNKNDKENQLSLVYANVLMFNRDSNSCLKEMLRYDPDIILAVETDKWWQEALRPLEKDYKHTVQLPLDNTYGMLLYSRLPLENTNFNFLTDKEIPSLNPLVTLPSGQKVNCFFIHPKPPVPGEADTSEQRDAELILVAREAKKSKLPVIVAGDLNDVGWSRTSELFQKISGLLDPRVGRGLFATYNAKRPFFRWPLDHVFHSREFRVLKLRKLNYIGSDHFPIYIKLNYEPENGHEHTTPVATKEDIKEANEKLD